MQEKSQPIMVVNYIICLHNPHPPKKKITDQIPLDVNVQEYWNVQELTWNSLRIVLTSAETHQSIS
jgi:hypothetical protein